VDEARALPSPCLVVLVGPGASGKTTWAAAHFPTTYIVSSDALRSMVGAGEDDITASADAFDLLDLIIERRVARGLTTVVDTLGLDEVRRGRWLQLAHRHRMPCIAVAFDTSAAECRERNRQREKRIPVDVLAAQLRAWPGIRAKLDSEGFDLVLAPTPVRAVAARSVAAATAAAQATSRQREEPTALRFGLHLGSFTWAGGAAATRDRLRRIARAAEEAGFDAIWVMDHFRQIPQVGRAWEDFLESWTTLAYLAAVTDRVRLGTLVTGITYRNVPHLGKIVATLDVLSGGRAQCGLGLAWHREEHVAYGWEFPPVAQRYAILEDALQVLPLLWGPGSSAFTGRVLQVPETLCYPRPLQPHVPMLVGGGGERRTLRLAAQYADACNVMGDLATVGRKVAVLRAHCADVGRDPAEVAVTHLSTTLVGSTDADVASLVERLRPRRHTASRYAASVHAGTVSDQVGRFRQLADVGVSEVMVRLPDLDDTAPLERMSSVIAAFRPDPA
jgi:F420-dependent oxidoreductase-like protein